MFSGMARSGTGGRRGPCLLVLLSFRLAAAQTGPCAGGAHPSCPDGSRPTGRPPSCPNGGQATCPDGSAPPAPGGNQAGQDPNIMQGNSPSSSSPHAAAMLGDVGLTTVSGTVTRTGQVLPVGENIFGPFEAGFGTQQDNILQGLGCSSGSLGHIAGGIDTKTAEEMVAFQCSITLPRVEGNQYISLLDECGGHTQEYHFHERMTCLYDGAAAGHSSKVGEITGGQPLYGKWESAGQLPLLDACGGHFGRTPESPNADVYHYHVQDNAPFTVGCIGPNDDNSLVTVQQCRAFYTGCNGNLVTVTTPQGSKQYDDWCPCYDAQGSNSGVNIAQLPVFNTAAGSLTLSLPSGTDACASSFQDALKESVAAAATQLGGATYTKSDVTGLTVGGCSGSRRRLQGTSQVVVSFTIRAASSAAAAALTSSISNSAQAFATAFESSMQTRTGVTVTATMQPQVVSMTPKVRPASIFYPLTFFFVTASLAMRS